MTALMAMDFDGSDVPYFLDDQQQPWWPIHGPCRVLGYDLSNPTQIMERLREDEKGRYPVPTLSKGTRGGGIQQVWCINEAGMYRLIFGSHKPEAEQFKDWIFHDVLPTIRRTGQYSLTNREIISAFLSPVFLPWEKRFELSFFQEVSRVYGQKMPTDDKHSPMMGWFIAKYIYDILPSSVRAEMDIINPILDKKDGTRKRKLHQLLQEDKVKDFLEKRMEQLMTVLRLCHGATAKEQFTEMMARHDATIGLEVKLSDTNRLILSMVLPQQLALL